MNGTGAKPKGTIVILCGNRSWKSVRMSQSMNESGSWKRIELNRMSVDPSLRCYVELHGNTVCESWSQRKGLCKLCHGDTVSESWSLANTVSKIVHVEQLMVRGTLERVHG